MSTAVKCAETESIKDDGWTFTRQGRSRVTVRLIKKKKHTLFNM